MIYLRLNFEKKIADENLSSGFWLNNVYIMTPSLTCHVNSDFVILYLLTEFMGNVGLVTSSARIQTMLDLVKFTYELIHLSLASHKWDIVKERSPR